MMDKVKDTFGAIGDKTMVIVDKVGMKRGLIGLAILVGATAGAIIAVKLIRSRRAHGEDEVDLGEELASPGVRRRRGKGSNATGASAGAH